MADEMTAREGGAPAACPKCGKKRPAQAESCPRCGLVFALWKAEAGVPLAPLDERGLAMWQEIQVEWSASARHEEFLKHCLQTNTLAAAGRLYREWLDDHPGDVVAAQMQSQILSKATLGLSIHKTPLREPVTRSKWFWVFVLTAMALGIAGGLFWRRFR
jgi:hypothetical protein